MINVLPHSDNKVEEVHFNKVLLSLGDRGALCHKEKMSIRNRFQEENNIFKIDEEDFRRIRSHVKNEVEEEKEEKYKQLEFEFDEDLVAPI